MYQSSFSALQRAENSSMLRWRWRNAGRRSRFSALQRAENSSIVFARFGNFARFGFQCSSASRKFLNPVTLMVIGFTFWSFSALQRAENSSIFVGLKRPVEKAKFQCSSASRKFLNRYCRCRTAVYRLFQCSSASRKFLNSTLRPVSSIRLCVSVLFSEPKIPQSGLSVCVVEVE